MATLQEEMLAEECRSNPLTSVSAIIIVLPSMSISNNSPDMLTPLDQPIDTLEDLTPMEM